MPFEHTFLSTYPGSMAYNTDDDNLERLMLNYTFDKKHGANAHPYDVSRSALTRSVPAYLQATNQKAVDLEKLSDYLDENNRIYRFAPVWIRLCSAVSQNELLAKHYTDKSLLDNTAFACEIYKRALTFPEAADYFDNSPSESPSLSNGCSPPLSQSSCSSPPNHPGGSSAKINKRRFAIECLEHVMDPERAALLEFTAPVVLIENLTAYETYTTKKFKWDDEFSVADFVQRRANAIYEFHGIDSCPEHANQSLVKHIKSKPIHYRQALPPWLRSIVAHACGQMRNGFEEMRNGFKVLGASEERLRELVEWSVEQADSDVMGHEEEAVQILRDLVGENPGILDG